MKRIMVMLFLVLALVLFSSCTTQPVPEVVEAEPAQEQTKTQLSTTLPDWVLNPPAATDGYFGVGYAQQTTLALSIKVAETRARADIASQIRVTIQEVVQIYSQESGVGNSKQVMDFVEIATKQVTDQTVSGVSIVSRHPLEDGGVWVLATYDTNALKEIVAKTVEKTAKEFAVSEEAAYAEWKAQNAFEYMDELLSTNPPQSTPIIE